MDRKEPEQESSQPKLICDLSAIPASARPRYHALRAQLNTALTSWSSIASGYEFRLDQERISLEEVSEWIEMERLCCPWLLLTYKPGPQITLEIEAADSSHIQQLLPSLFMDKVNPIISLEEQ